MDVREAVKRIQLLSGAFVDCSFRQGRNAVLKQLEERTGRDEEAFVDVYIQEMQDTMATLIHKAVPYEVPEDYIFFLEFYGGLAIDRDDYNFSILGIGPMVEDWYGSVESDEAFPEPAKYGFLSLGSLNFREGKYKFQHVDFFLDLAGIIQKHCVIGVGPWGQAGPTPSTIIQDIHAHPGRWQKIAPSFTEWLEQAAETGGAFSYT